MAQLKQKRAKVVGVKNFNNQNNIMSNTTQITANHLQLKRTERKKRVKEQKWKTKMVRDLIQRNLLIQQLHHTDSIKESLVSKNRKRKLITPSKGSEADGSKRKHHKHDVKAAQIAACKSTAEILFCTDQVHSMEKEISRLRGQFQPRQNLDSDDDNVSQVSSL